MGVLTRRIEFLAAPSGIAVASYTETAFNTTTSPKTLTGMSWSTGDVIVIAAAAGNESIAVDTPTNANLTFSLAESEFPGGGGDTESPTWIWTATAGSSQSSQSINIQETGGTTAFGASAWVLTGASGVGVTSSNLTETALSLTVAAGSAVFYILADWNAAAAGRTATTGSGTHTVRENANESGFYTLYIGEWLGTSAGTYSFGITDYSSMIATQSAIEITKA